WHLHGMDEGHSEDPGVEIDGHLRVVGVEREMMHATEADRALGTGVAAILELNIVMEPPLDRWRLGQCKSLAQHRLSSVSSTIGQESLHLSHAWGGFRTAPVSAKFAPFLIESR